MATNSSSDRGGRDDENKDEIIAKLKSQLQEYEKLTANLALDNTKLKDISSTLNTSKNGDNNLNPENIDGTSITVLKTGDQIFLRYEGMFYYLMFIFFFFFFILCPLFYSFYM